MDLLSLAQEISVCWMRSLGSARRRWWRVIRSRLARRRLLAITDAVGELLLLLLLAVGALLTSLLALSLLGWIPFLCS